MSDQGYDVIESHGRYVLGETENAYGIWDRSAVTGPIERFPVTEEGFERAWERFGELKRLDRRERGVLTRVLWASSLVGVVLWLLAGTLGALIAITRTLTDELLLDQVVFVVDALGFRLALGSLLVLAVMKLVGWQRRPSSPSSAPSGSEASPASPEVGRSARFLGWALTFGLIVWIVSSVATEWLFRFDIQTFGQEPSRASIAAEVTAAFAFRVWVAAFVLLAVLWGKRVLRPRGSARLAAIPPSPWRSGSPGPVQPWGSDPPDDGRPANGSVPPGGPARA